MQDYFKKYEQYKSAIFFEHIGKFLKIAKCKMFRNMEHFCKFIKVHDFSKKMTKCCGALGWCPARMVEPAVVPLLSLAQRPPPWPSRVGPRDPMAAGRRCQNSGTRSTTGVTQTLCPPRLSALRVQSHSQSAATVLCRRPQPNA